jgi:CheY-like chemotaxis protein
VAIRGWRFETRFAGFFADRRGAYGPTNRLRVVRLRIFGSAVAAIPETRVQRRILVVDDQAPVLETLGAMLTNSGYRVYGVLSGAQALSAARLTAYDAALIDIHMPMMDGFETALRLREQTERRGRTIRMWHITGMDNPTYEDRSARCGMMGLLLKPFNSAQLCKALEAGFASPIPAVAAPDAET